MATVQLTPAATAEQTAVLSTGNYPRVMVSATGLAGAETASVQRISPDGTAVAVVDDDNNAATLTVAKPSVIVAGGVDYLVTKGVTAGNAFVSFSPITHPN
jgi:hypothetical protein